MMLKISVLSRGRVAVVSPAASVYNYRASDARLQSGVGKASRQEGATFRLKPS